MKIQILASAACAALIVVAQPASALATSPEMPVSLAAIDSLSLTLAQFYASRANAPLWMVGQNPTSATASFLNVLDRAALDGLASGSELAARARTLIARGASGEADRLLSSALVLYVQAIQTPPPGMGYGDSWVAPRRSSPGQILATAAAAPSLASHIARISAPNPIYTQLRDAAYAEMAITGGAPDERVVASLARVREAPFQKRYIMIDAASATLWMVEDGRIADSMKVIVGKADAPTPMLASTIYYATLNPYWNVPGDLVKGLIAPRVAAQGVKYITDHNYDVLSDYGADATPVDPKTVDWSAVAAGMTLVKLRQRPNPANSMGKMKFGFANTSDIYLHDSPNKDLFAQDDRSLSHGCIRLSDAPRLGRWLLGRDAVTADQSPEQHVLLPTPVPIYVTYLTAQARDGRIAFVEDIYGRDRLGSQAIASLR